MEDVFAIQDEISQAIVNTLKVKLLSVKIVGFKIIEAPLR